MDDERSEVNMTVRELIEQLQALPQDLKVIVEGCDCYGWAEKAVVQERTWDIPPRTVVAIYRGEEL